MPRADKENQLVKQLEKDTSDSNEIVRAAAHMVIESDQQASEVATGFLMAVHQKLKAVDAKREELIAPLRASIKGINDLFAPVIDSLEKAKTIIKDGICEYIKENPEHGKIDGVKDISTYKFVVTDITKVPLEFLTIDSKALNYHVKKTKGIVDIPGITVFKHTNISIDAGRESNAE